MGSSQKTKLMPPFAKTVNVFKKVLGKFVKGGWGRGVLTERIGFESEAKALWRPKVPAASGCWSLKSTKFKILTNFPDTFLELSIF